MNNYPDYDLVNDALTRIECEQDAAEQHGQLCALLCLIETISLEQWLGFALPKGERGDALVGETRSILSEIYQATVDSIDSEVFDFHLLLPDDDMPLSQRLQAVSHWCQGFLMGITHAGITDIEKLSSNLPEIVRDFVEISRAENFEIENSEEDEASYVEISEFVRMGTLLFRVEFKQFLSKLAETESDKKH